MTVDEMKTEIELRLWRFRSRKMEQEDLCHEAMGLTDEIIDLLMDYEKESL
jgi:hypothetical protein